MSKNKFVKALLALGIGAISATAIIGMAACGGDSGNGGAKQLSAPVIAFDTTNPKKIKWDAVEHATGYTVYEKLKTASSATAQPSQTACEYTITQTVAGTYEYYVVATSTSSDYTTSAKSKTLEYTVQPTSAATFTVSFDTDGGSPIDDQNVKAGELAQKPENDPKKDNQVFVGWYDQSKTTVFDFTKPIIEKTVVYAKWRDETQYDKLLAESTADTLIVNEQFDAISSVPEFDDYGTAGIYQTRNNKTDVSLDANKVVVSNGVAEVIDTSSGATSLVIDFGHVTGTVKGYFETTLASQGNGWTLFQLYGSDTKVTNGEVFAVRTDNGKFAYRQDGTLVTQHASLAVADATLYQVYYEIDLTAGTVTFDINGTKIVNGLELAGLSNVQGLKLVTSDSGSRTFKTVDNIIVVGEKLSASAYATAQATKLETKYATVTDTTLGDLSTGISDLITTHKGNITGANSYEAVDSAYKAGVTAIDAKILTNAKTSACTKIDAYRNDETITTNADKLTAAKTNGKNAVNEATVDTVEKVVTAYKAALEACNAVENDELANTKNIVVTVKYTPEGGSVQTLGTFTAKSGIEYKNEDILKAIQSNIPEGLKLAGFYPTAELTAGDKLATGYTKTVSENGEDEIYAKLIKPETTTHTLDGTDVSKTAYTTDTQIGSTIFYATNKVKAEKNKVTQVTDETQHISLTGGKVATNQNAIKFTISGKATVTVVAASKSDKDCTLSVLDSKGNDAIVTNLKKDGSDLAAFDDLNKVGKNTYTFTLEAGTYYLGSGKTGGAYIYHITIVEEVA